MIHQLGLCTFTAEDTTDSVPGQELRSCKPHKKRKGGTGAEESLKKQKQKKTSARIYDDKQAILPPKNTFTENCSWTSSKTEPLSVPAFQ